MALSGPARPPARHLQYKGVSHINTMNWYRVFQQFQGQNCPTNLCLPIIGAVYLTVVVIFETHKMLMLCLNVLILKTYGCRSPYLCP